MGNAFHFFPSTLKVLLNGLPDPQMVPYACVHRGVLLIKSPETCQQSSSCSHVVLSFSLSPKV